MRVLILGLSSLASRRLLPALDAAASFTAVDIGTTKAEDARQQPASKKLGTIYKGYETAIESSPAELVYVSLVNSFHELWAERALEAGKHVIVDKPAFLSFRAAEMLCALAKKRKLLLAEALVYPFHPQLDEIRRIFHEAGDSPLRVSAMLTIPPLDPGNFRYQASLGGGALWDLGPYAASIGRVFFESAPDDVLCRVNTSKKDVDISFSTLVSHPDGKSVAGHFGFDTQYENRVTVTGAKVSMTLERVFTTPPKHWGELKIVREGGNETLVCPEADSFERFFSAVGEAIESKKTTPFAKVLLHDAAVLDTMRQDAKVKHAH